MKGFISITFIAIIAVATVALGGAGYGVYKYQEVKKEKEQIKVELDQKKDKEISRLESELNAAKEEAKEIEEPEPSPKPTPAPTPAPAPPSTPTTPANTGYTPTTNSPTPTPISEHLDGAKKVMKRAYDDANSSKAKAVVNGSIHKTRISTAQDNIDFGKGYIKVYPELKSLISYFENIYEQQIEYDQKAVLFSESVIDYSNVIMDGYDTLISSVDSAAEKEHIDLIEFFGNAQFVIKENNQGLTEWMTNSSSLDTQIQGIVSAAQAKNSSAGMPKTVEVVYPTVTTPVVNNRIQCYSEGFIGGTLTTCN